MGILGKNNNPKINIGKKAYYVAKYVWNYHNQDNLIDTKSKCVYLCKNQLCVKIEHLSKESRIKDIDYKQVWERLLKYGENKKMGVSYGMVEFHYLDMVNLQFEVIQY
jgi:hypothetical protein